MIVVFIFQEFLVFQGTTVGRLAKDLEWLRNELFIRNVDVGFHGDSKDVVLYARCLLTNKLVHRVYSHFPLFLCCFVLSCFYSIYYVMCEFYFILFYTV